MSFRTFQTVACDCDACGEPFADTCEATEAEVWAAAMREGWEERDGKHLCRRCVGSPEWLSEFAVRR